MPPMNGLEVLVQTERPDREFSCQGFAGLPVAEPAQIIILTAHKSADELTQADNLRVAVCQSLAQLTTPTSQPPMPCAGHISTSSGCHAFPRADVTVVLAYLSMPGPGTPPTLPPWYPRSAAGPTGSRDRVIPILPVEGDPRQLLPDAIAGHHAKAIHTDVSEAVPDILAAAGVTSDEFRIFISYRWQDASSLADQLFDALARVNFEIFLDRFRQAPGTDFAGRINEALADMSFVLVLETKTIAQSPWVGMEVAYARNNHLGLLALHLPNSAALTRIDPDHRIDVDRGDLTLGASGPIISNDLALARVVERVRAEHGLALAERQQYIRGNMRDALLFAGAGSVVQGASGVLQVAGGAGEYGINVTARPPALGDFQDCDVGANPGATRVVGGPTVHLRRLRQSRIEWLSGRTSIRLFDEADIVDIARDVVGGTL
jgi:hypothetical protein